MPCRTSGSKSFRLAQRGTRPSVDGKPGAGKARQAIVASLSFSPHRLDSIRIRGARTHNLKNLSLELPRNRLVVITGLSGSGKSSLAFDTLYAEGQRRYVESLSAYA